MHTPKKSTNISSTIGRKPAAAAPVAAPMNAVSEMGVSIRILVLVGAPGSSINQAPNPGIAREACKMVQARLPTEKEYEYLSILGDWNGGVSLDHMFWALPDQQVLSPDTRNPTPVRSHAEVQFATVNFYCVK